MKQEQFFSVGKLILKRAIGLQRNFKEIEYKTISKLDERASGCFGCQNYSLKKVYANQKESEVYKTACEFCESCPARVFVEKREEVVKYINEKNKYGRKQGYSATLKTNGIKLLLVLHMMHPNRFGHILDLSVSGLKDIMNCDRKTIVANLERLKSYGYIDYVKSCERGLINVIVKGYEDYFKPAKEGGRGFLTFSKELVEALLDIEDLTTLRIFLHQLVETDDHSCTEQKVFEKTYKELQRALPEYYKPNHIKKGLLRNLTNPIFDLSVKDKVVFVLNPEYDSKKVKQKLILNNKSFLTEYVDQLNDKFIKINEGKLRPENCLPEIFCEEEKAQEYVPFVIGKKTITDLAKMSWQTSVYEIMDTLDYVYVNYVLKHRSIENMAGLVRVLMPQVLQMKRKSELAA